MVFLLIVTVSISFFSAWLDHLALNKFVRLKLQDFEKKVRLNMGG